MGNIPIIENVREIPIIFDRWQAPEGYEVYTFGQYKKYHPHGTEEQYYKTLQELIFKDQQERYQYNYPPDLPNRLQGLLTLSRDLTRNMIPPGYKNLTHEGQQRLTALREYKQQKKLANERKKAMRKGAKQRYAARLHEYEPSPMSMKMHRKYGLGLNTYRSKK